MLTSSSYAYVQNVMFANSDNNSTTPDSHSTFEDFLKTPFGPTIIAIGGAALLFVLVLCCYAIKHDCAIHKQRTSNKTSNAENYHPLTEISSDTRSQPQNIPSASSTRESNLPQADSLGSLGVGAAGPASLRL